MSDFSALLTKALDKNHLTLSALGRQKIVRYLELLEKWNRVFNLTHITHPAEMVYLHIIDSLVISPFLKGLRCLDVGSGAGLPGIPLAIFNPDQQWVVLDKNSKKIHFLRQVIAELDLKNITAVHTRVEDFHPPFSFDSILSRAFASLSVFLNTTAHLGTSEGRWIAMKGKFPQEELDDVPAHFVVEKVIRLEITGIEIERHIVCIRITNS